MSRPPKFVSFLDPEQPLEGELTYPQHGLRPRVGEGRPGPGVQGWERLVLGQPLGKRSNMLFETGDIGQIQRAIPFFQMRGDDRDAMPLTLTLIPPEVVFLQPADAIDSAQGNIQNIGGSQDNTEVSDDDFPGTAIPITWPPMLARVKWGTGGINTFADVDLCNGVALNLHASFVEVWPYLDLTEANGISGTSAVYSLGGFLSPGYTRPGNAQRTVYAGTITANEEGVTFPVPRFAKRAYLVGNDKTALTPQLSVGTLRFWQNVLGAGDANAQNLANYYFAGVTSFQSVEIPNGAMYFSVLSGMSVNARFAVIFDLMI